MAYGFKPLAASSFLRSRENRTETLGAASFSSLPFASSTDATLLPVFRRPFWCVRCCSLTKEQPRCHQLLSGEVGDSRPPQKGEGILPTVSSSLFLSRVPTFRLLALLAACDSCDLSTGWLSRILPAISPPGCCFPTARKGIEPPPLCSPNR